MIFDGSLRTSTPYSLIDNLLQSFIIQHELLNILCRYCIFRFVIICDIEKIFVKLIVFSDQTFLLNILWKESKDQILKCFELSTDTYGKFLATSLFKQIG